MKDQQLYQNCIDACLRCVSVCNHCATSCLKEDDVKMMVRCIQLDMECAAICYAAAQVISIGGQLTQEICKICAAICQACGDECIKHEHNHCKECADACYKCAEECRNMIDAIA